MMKVVLFILLLLLSVAGCHTQSRESNQFRIVHLPVGTEPNVVLAADVNSDNNLDVLVSNGGSGNVSVYLGDGKGQFVQASGSPVAAGPEPNDIAIADLNGDRKLDMAIANHGTKTLTVLLGNGQGQFTAAPGSPINVDSRPHPHGIASADLNGDGKSDLAVDSWSENKVLWLSGNGDGTFQTPGVKVDVGAMPYYRLRTADLNEDGHSDIVTSNFEGNSVSVLFADGKGNFKRSDYRVPPACFGLAIADVNGDQHLDIAVNHYSGQGTDRSKDGVSLLFGDGKGNFTLASGSPYPTGHYPPTVTAGDLNGDRIADVVVPNHEDGTLTIYFGGRNGLTAANYSPYRAGRNPNGVTVADFNRDGKGDIVVSDEGANEILVLLQR